jgi:putative DNA primase/helicase
MEYGPRGIGKTMFGQSLACSLVTGEPFMRWTPTAPVGVLYIDGEMTLDALRTRFVNLLPPVKPTAALELLSSEVVYENTRRDLRLTDANMRQAVDEVLADREDLRVVVIDNISCLFSGLDEDKKNSWEEVVPWLLSLWHRGVTAVLVHHAGKGGDQRGTSGREDLLDTVIRLERPADHTAEDGARFVLRFTKSRGVTGEEVAPLEAKLVQGEDGRLTWACQSPAESLLLRFLRAIDEGVDKQAELPEELSVHRGSVSKVKTQAVAAGLIAAKDGVLSLTEEGRRRIHG